MTELWNVANSNVNQIGINGNTWRAFGLRVLAGSPLIGETLTKFSMRLNTLNASTNEPYSFGIFNYSTGMTLHHAFTGSISNNNQLTTTVTEYEWSGSATLAENDIIGMGTTSVGSANLAQVYLNNSSLALPSGTQSMGYDNSQTQWDYDSYGNNQPMIGIGTGSASPTPGSAGTVMPPPIAVVRL